MTQNARLIRNVTRRLGVTRAVRRAVGNQNYRQMKRLAKGLNETAKSRAEAVRRWPAERQLLRLHPELMRSNVLYQPLGQRLPEQVRMANLEQVTEILTASSIDWFLVRNDSRTRWTIGVMEEARGRLIECLAAGLRTEAVYVADATPGTRNRRSILAGELHSDDMMKDVLVLRLASYYRDDSNDFQLGFGYSCDIEFWQTHPLDSSIAIAPRRNVAAQAITLSEMQPEVMEIDGRHFPTLAVFKEQMVDDVNFPIDAVYTWVDGDDAKWIDSKAKLESELLGIEYHAEANHTARFRSRDELKYSLRSLEMYAPWFRRIYLVTNGQVPSWLKLDHPKVKVITHDEIYDDASNLPTFNSNSIISRLHHIPGLSEHYVYINDDVFFGRPVSPSQFFLASGIAKVSVSNNRRPFGDPDVMDEPHINLTRNMRSLLRESFGITISRAIKHTPHPQLASVHFEMEKRYIDTYRATWASHFRHHTDIVADQLFHYYAQITGKAVPASLRYNYVNILDDTYEATMWSMLRYRDRDTFCMNDAPVEGATPIEDDKVDFFLARYFPIKSSFEI